MKSNLIASVLFIAHFASIGWAGQNPRKETHQFFLAPREDTLSVIAYQPNCPLLFEKANSYYHIGGGGLPDYKVRNRTSKTIAKFTIRIINVLGGGDYSVSFDGKDPKRWIRPGKYWPESKEDENSEVIALSDNLHKEYSVGPPMKAVLVFMIERVEFDDGTIYSDEPVSKALQELSEKVELKSLSKSKER
ncbi:MAG: hypothetical protein HY231_01150 [Acidobacteria bacterium]|nr:hypothetical protein [Acidobacteriota bacterium]